ncbi:MAG: hypothetical protein QGI60_04980, partial [archaeon]|nr:hypothetical protein [archaeon]
FGIPKFLNNLEIPEKVGPAGNPIGYRHMCRFFTGAIYQQPALREYDWYWRFDTDSFLLGKVDYDVFKFMAKNNLQYGYNRITHDPPSVVAGLGDATKKYIEDNNITPNFLSKFMQDGEWDRAMYYTNFEISKMSFWRSKEVVAFFNYLDRLGGIYTRRWGDAPIHLLIVSIFLPENQTHCFRDVPYRHHKCIVVPAKT